MTRTPTSSSIPTRPTVPGDISCSTTVPSASGNYDQIDGEHRKILGYRRLRLSFRDRQRQRAARDGQIEVAQRWNNQKQGVHCRNARTHDVDEYGIGICLVGDFDQQPPTPRQIAATQALIAYLSKRYNIEPEPRRGPMPTSPPPRPSAPASIFPSEAMLTLTKDAA